MKWGLSLETLTQLQSVFKKFPQIEEVILYGSRAKGNFRTSSDIDLTLKGQKLNLRILAQIEEQIDDLLLPYGVDLSILDEIQNPELIEHIRVCGQRFYTQLGYD
jgi:predicted nucleotidyltransferase